MASYFSRFLQAAARTVVPQSSRSTSSASKLAGGASLGFESLEPRTLLAGDMAEITGTRLKPTYGPTRSGDVPHSLADISAAVRDLAFDPRVGVRKGLEQTLAFYIPSSSTG